MKKTFKLQATNKHPDRVVEGIKHEVRKYIKREKRKTLPEGVDFWKFECKFAKNDEEPQVIDFLDITKYIDEAHASKSDSLYMEILATKGYKQNKELESSTEDETL